MDQEVVAPDMIRERGNSDGRLSSDEDGVEGYSVDEETREDEEDQEMGSWSPYVYLNPQHFRP